MCWGNVDVGGVDKCDTTLCVGDCGGEYGSNIDAFVVSDYGYVYGDGIVNDGDTEMCVNVEIGVVVDGDVDCLYINTCFDC